jgi:hypothetical protein
MGNRRYDDGLDRSVEVRSAASATNRFRVYFGCTSWADDIRDHDVVDNLLNDRTKFLRDEDTPRQRWNRVELLRRFCLTGRLARHSGLSLFRFAAPFCFLAPVQLTNLI